MTKQQRQQKATWAKAWACPPPSQATDMGGGQSQGHVHHSQLTARPRLTSQKANGPVPSQTVPTIRLLTPGI